MSYVLMPPHMGVVEVLCVCMSGHEFSIAYFSSQ